VLHLERRLRKGPRYVGKGACAVRTGTRPPRCPAQEAQPVAKEAPSRVPGSAGPRGRGAGTAGETLIKLNAAAKLAQGGLSIAGPHLAHSRSDRLPPPRASVSSAQGGVERPPCGHRCRRCRLRQHPSPRLTPDPHRPLRRAAGKSDTAELREPCCKPDRFVAQVIQLDPIKLVACPENRNRPRHILRAQAQARLAAGQPENRWHRFLLCFHARPTTTRALCRLEIERTPNPESEHPRRPDCRNRHYGSRRG